MSPCTFPSESTHDHERRYNSIIQVALNEESRSHANADRLHQDMNDDQPSSSTSRPEDGQHMGAAPAAAKEVAERRKKNRQMFNKKRGELLDHLCRDLDLIIYAELSTVYYMDCSFLRFVLRAFIQFMFLTPKPAAFPQQPADTPIIGALLGTNLLCLLAHIWLNAPSAGEATRGYLHGGVAMDFIGQKGPSSKFYLVLLDLLVVSLQLVQLASNSVRKKVKEVPATASPAARNATIATHNATSSATQDLDSEERGVRRSHEEQDIEMQTLNPSGTATSGTTNATTSEAEAATESSDRDALLATTTAPRTDAHIFDAFNSGQIVVADLDLWKEIKDQFKLAMEKRSDTSSRTSSQALRAELAQRVLRMRLGTDALRQSL